jgi:hypothetical protein
MLLSIEAEVGWSRLNEIGMGQGSWLLLLFKIISSIHYLLYGTLLYVSVTIFLFLFQIVKQVWFC